MKVSDVQGLLTKVQQVAGDVPVVLKDIESGNISGLVSVGIELVADAAAAVNQVTITHGQQAPQPAPPLAPADPPPGQ